MARPVKTSSWRVVALCVVVSLMASPALANPAGERAQGAARLPAAHLGAPVASRSAATGLGLVLTALGLGGIGLGVGGLLVLGSLDTTTAPYLPVDRDDSATVRILIDRHDRFTTLTVASFATGGALLVGGIIALLLDTPRAPQLALVPTREGALVSLGLRW